MRQQDHWFFRMINHLVSEIGLVIQNKRNEVSTGNIFRGNYREFIPGQVTFEQNIFDPATSDWTSNRNAMNHPFERKVVNIQGFTRDLFAAFFSGNGLSERMIWHLFGSAPAWRALL